MIQAKQLNFLTHKPSDNLVNKISNVVTSRQINTYTQRQTDETELGKRQEADDTIIWNVQQFT